jgi:adenylate cyclase
MVQERPVSVGRRLAAIVAADVAGYSRLMHSDEEATHAKLSALIANSVTPAIAEHGGRIVKNTGDGFLAGVSKRGGGGSCCCAVSDPCQRTINR